MKTYFDLEATFEGYLAGTITPSNIDLFVFDCQPRQAINIHTVPEFINRDKADNLKKWQEFQRILGKAHIDSRICFLINDRGQRIGTRSIEQIYQNTDSKQRYWYGKERETA